MAVPRIKFWIFRDVPTIRKWISRDVPGMNQGWLLTREFGA